MADNNHDTTADGFLSGLNDPKKDEKYHEMQKGIVTQETQQNEEVESFSLQSEFSLEAYTKSSRIKTRSLHPMVT
jgi:hypothetical protein